VIDSELQPFGFEPTYQVTPAFLPNGEVDMLEFRPEGQPGRAWPASGPLLQVRTEAGREWYGVFQEGDYPLSAMYCGPSPDHLCVVAGGEAYIVPVAEPRRYLRVATYPVLEVHRIPQREVLAFVDFIHIVAYSTTGILWRSKRVSVDGMRITSVGPAYIEGVTDGDEIVPGRPFRIDVESGFVEGGDAGYVRRQAETEAP